MNSVWILVSGIILIVLSIANKNSKNITFLMYAFIWLVYTFCNGGNPDLEVYRWTYYDHIYVTSFGFDMMMRIFESAGLPFFVFKGVCGIFTLYFYRKTFQMYFRQENVVLALGILCPLTASIAQIRNGMMAAFVLYAVSRFILDEKNRIWPYIIRVILIAVLIHPVAFVYLVLLLSKKTFKEENRLKISLAILLIVVVEIIITQNLLYNIASLIIKNEKILQWFDYQAAFAAVNEETWNLKGKLVLIFEQLIGTGIVFFAVKQYKRKFQPNDKIRKEQYILIMTNKQLQVIKNIFLLLLFVLPLYQLSAAYFRVFMNVIPMIYILVVQLISQAKGNFSIPKNRLFFCTIVYAFLISYLAELGYTLSMFNSFGIG